MRARRRLRRVGRRADFVPGGWEEGTAALVCRDSSSRICATTCTNPLRGANG